MNSYALRLLAALVWTSALAVVATTLPVLVEPVQAAEKADKKGPKIGPKVGKPLKAAQELTAKKKWTEALAKVKEADAIGGKSAFEEYTVQDFLAYININLKNYAQVVKSYQATIDSEFLPPEEKPRRLKIITQLLYQEKNYPDAITWGNRYLKATGGRDVETQLLIGQSYYLQKDYPNAAKAVDAAIDLAKKAGQQPKEEWYQLVMSSAYEMKDDTALAAALERILAQYPTSKYWGDRIRLVEDKAGAGISNRLNLDVYRLKLATGALDQAAEYVEMSELALELGLPGEARSVLEKGFSSGVLTAGENDRNKRLLASAKTQAETDQKLLPALEKEAAKAKTGDAEVKLGEAYWSYGDHAKAAEAIQRGLTKGSLKTPDEAQLHLGLVQLGAGQKDAAKESLGAVPAGALGDLAKLWAIYADHGAGTATAAAQAPAAAAQ